MSYGLNAQRVWMARALDLRAAHHDGVAHVRIEIGFSREIYRPPRFVVAERKGASRLTETACLLDGGRGWRLRRLRWRGRRQESES